MLLDPQCWKCVRLIPHFFHDDGRPVQGWPSADPDCQQCYGGEPHHRHDNKAFNTQRYWKED